MDKKRSRTFWIVLILFFTVFFTITYFTLLHPFQRLSSEYLNTETKTYKPSVESGTTHDKDAAKQVEETSDKPIPDSLEATTPAQTEDMSTTEIPVEDIKNTPAETPSDEEVPDKNELPPEEHKELLRETESILEEAKLTREQLSVTLEEYMPLLAKELNALSAEDQEAVVEQMLDNMRVISPEITETELAEMKKLFENKLSSYGFVPKY